MKSRSFPILPLLAVLGAIVSLSIGTTTAKTIFPMIGSEGVTLLRVATATLILGVVFRPWRRRVARADWPILIGYGASIGVMNLLFYEAVARMPYGIAVAFEFCGPLGVAIFSSRRLIDFVWVALAIVGLSLLLPIGQNAGHFHVTGVAFALGAAVCWATYIVIGSRAGRRLHGGQVTAIGMAVATLVVIPFGVARAGTALLAPRPFTTGLAVGLLSGAIPFGLEMFALKRLPKQTFSVLLSLEPAFAALAAWPMLGERLTPIQSLAIACVVVASIGSASNARSEPPPPTVD